MRQGIERREVIRSFRGSNGLKSCGGLGLCGLKRVGLRPVAGFGYGVPCAPSVCLMDLLDSLVVVKSGWGDFEVWSGFEWGLSACEVYKNRYVGEHGGVGW